MSEPKTIELLEGGLDAALRDIQSHLDEALATKNKKKKDLMISYANGVANAIYRMTKVTADEKVEVEE